MLQPMGSQRVSHNLVAEQQQRHIYNGASAFQCFLPLVCLSLSQVRLRIQLKSHLLCKAMFWALGMSPCGGRSSLQ